ncbi:MAG: ribonuclease P protein component [Candidatus Paceibacterota bacterium]|jgi:ribonuclease P protein component
MLPKNQRIKKGDFGELINSGRSFYSPNFNLRAMKKKDITTKSLLAVVVSKKVANKAVTRNFLKRRLKYALVKKSLDLKSGFLIAFWLKKDLSKTKYADFEAEVLTLLKQANLTNA